MLYTNYGEQIVIPTEKNGDYYFDITYLNDDGTVQSTESYSYDWENNEVTSR